MRVLGDGAARREGSGGAGGEGKTGSAAAGGGNEPTFDAGATGTSDGDAGLGCSEAASLIYVVGTGNELCSFYPPTLEMKQVGSIACPSGGFATPFSRTVDRKGHRPQIDCYWPAKGTTTTVKTNVGFHLVGAGVDLRARGTVEAIGSERTRRRRLPRTIESIVNRRRSREANGADDAAFRTTIEPIRGIAEGIGKREAQEKENERERAAARGVHSASCHGPA